MLRNRLSELLAERNLKITRVANDIPNLSRNTITATAQNESKMIQLETINSLCQYLGVQPNDFLEFVPFDIDISAAFSSPEKTEVEKGDFAEAINLSDLEVDLFMKQSSIKEEVGERTKTFDLTVLLTNDVKIPLIDDVDGPQNTEISFQVMLGHLNDADTFNKQQSDFTNMWRTELTPGFRAILQKRISETVTKEFTGQIDVLCKYAENKGFQKVNVDWNNFTFTYNFTFEDAFGFIKDPFSKSTVEFVTDSLPF